MQALKKIGIIGTQCVGKTTLIADMKEKWPCFETPSKDYRDLIKKKKLPVNKEATKESQQLIMDSLVDQAMTNFKKKKMIFDRTPIDNLVYSLWLYDKGLGGIDEAFLEKSVKLVRESIKFYSIIFYLPFCEENDVPLTAAPNRDIDPVYRSEIGHLFEGIYKAWEKGGSRFFDTDDCPAFIPIFGSRQERIALMSMYINDKGEFYGESDSLVANAVEQEFLRKNLLGKG
jgi:predicted ATPase